MLAMIPLAILAIASLLGGAAMIMAFFRRLPAVVVAFASMIVASLSDMIVFTANQLWFWGIAAAIALAIEYTVRPPQSNTRAIYTVAGALAGAVIGLAMGTEAAVIIASVVGSLLGYMAYGMTPAGRKEGSVRPALDDLASVALPAVVNFSILMLIFAQLVNN